MNNFSNRLTRADKLNNELISLRSKLREATEKKKKYVTFYAINREKFNILHRQIENKNSKLEILIDNINRTSMGRRSSRKKQMYVQRLIDAATKKKNALIKTLKKYRQQGLEMEKVMEQTDQHITEPKRIADEMNRVQLQFQELTTRGRGKKTKRRKIKKKQTKRRKKPRKKKN